MCESASITVSSGVSRVIGSIVFIGTHCENNVAQFFKGGICASFSVSLRLYSMRVHGLYGAFNCYCLVRQVSRFDTVSDSA